MRSNSISVSNNDSWRGGLLRFAHDAMATRFEILALHEDPHYARQAAEAAFAELDRLEQMLSRFIETSDIARINHLSPGEQTRIGLDAFHCLHECLQLYNETNGAFDIGAGELFQAWKHATLNDDEIEMALKHGGIKNIKLHSDSHSICLAENTVTIDLGGYGKGYALDRMADILLEWDIECALLHGGMSTALALNPPPNEAGWPITISHPCNIEKLKSLSLSNEAISGSGLQKGSHIIDPRTGRPANQAVAAWAQTQHAARADALSTSFMIMDQHEVSAFVQAQPQDQGAILTTEGNLIWFSTSQTA
ncbi:FAD:protein FMN transferase [bacterium]|nr:FAD:protein FMN transferase [bacterium]